MSGIRAMLALVGARARRRPGRWLLTALGLALATAASGTVAAESTIAGDQAARSVLNALPASDRTVRVTWQDLVTPTTERQASSLLRSLGLGDQTEVVLVNPVRLDGIVIRPAAIEPLSRWTGAARSPGPCRASACPMLLAGGDVKRVSLTAPGIDIPIAGKVTLASAAPLGFTAAEPSDQPPLLLSGDAAGLEALGGLSSLYRTHSWLAALPIGALQSWQLPGLERRLQQAQVSLQQGGGAFSLIAPFDGLDAARAQAGAAHRRLLLAGGGALAALALFIVLAASGLKRDIDSELRRLESAGARASQRLAFVSAEAGLLCGSALPIGYAVAVTVAAALASGAGLPASGVLTHSLLTSAAAAALVLGWVCATALVVLALLARSARVADLLAVAAVAALALALTRGSGGGNDPLPVLLAPLSCLAAGLIVFRLAAALLRGGERLARRGPVLARLALVDLARAPAAPALAIAFIAVSTGLGGFALAYRATLLRGASDQAAQQVPLDAIVSAGNDFTTPLALAPISRWRSIAGGAVMPVRRSEASFLSGGSSVTIAALGVPASALPRLHGWRSGDGSAPMATLSRRLVAPGPVRVPGVEIPAAATALSLTAAAPAIAISLTAELRDRDGTIHQLTLGTAGARARTLVTRLPARRADGPWELEALALAEPAGLEITNGHQNGENTAAATQFATTLRLGTLSINGRGGRSLATVRLGAWRAVGAASLEQAGAREAAIRFTASGQPGLLRPLQPSDIRPVSVLADPQTAAAAGRTGWLPLTVDGLPVSARIVGVLQRFPTVSSDQAGFVVADQQTLASALDAQSPGQGRADELWIAAANTDRLRAALRKPPDAQLSVSLRRAVEQQLRAAPLAQAMVRTLLAAAAFSGALAVVGLLVALLGVTRDRRIERDLTALGVGPRGLRRELRLRLMLAGVLGVSAGVLIGTLLTTLAVATARASGSIAVADPPLVTVAPWGQLGLWALAAITALAAAAWVSTRSALREAAS